MKCEELEPLQGPYLDSELDASLTLSIQQHLAECPRCAHAFAKQEQFQAAIANALNRGQRSPALWEQVERAVLSAASDGCRRHASTRRSLPAGWRTVLPALVRQLRTSLQPRPGAWAGLAAVWGVVFILNFTAPESDTRFVGRDEAPSGAEMRLALAQKQLLMTELTPPSEAAGVERPKATSPGPRSDRRDKTLNS